MYTVAADCKSLSFQVYASINYFVNKCLNTCKYFWFGFNCSKALVYIFSYTSFSCTYIMWSIHNRHCLNLCIIFPLTAVTIFSPAIEEEPHQQTSQPLVQMKSKMLPALILRYAQNQRVASANSTRRCYHFCNSLIVPKQRPFLLYLKKPQSSFVGWLALCCAHVQQISSTLPFGGFP